MTPAALGVDEITRIEHYGRYVARTVVPPRFIWDEPRVREVDCPLMAWRIGNDRFRAVIPVTFLPNGREDSATMLRSLQSLIAESKARRRVTTGKGE